MQLQKFGIEIRKINNVKNLYSDVDLVLRKHNIPPGGINSGLQSATTAHALQKKQRHFQKSGGSRIFFIPHRIMKITAVIVFALMLFACDQTGPEETEFGAFGRTIEVTVDSCEYVFAKAGSAGGFAHKGNCKNPIHKY